jgi:hypothetical protein
MKPLDPPRYNYIDVKLDTVWTNPRYQTKELLDALRVIAKMDTGTAGRVARAAIDRHEGKK